jgi:general nucleoside transport system permease protein
MIELLASTLRLATPLIFAAMGGLFCERAGVATICLEGVMLTGAWAAATATYFTQDPYIGICAGLVAGVLTMWLHALLAVQSKADAIVSGVAVNLFATGITPLLNKIFFGGTANTPSLSLDQRLSNVPIPGLDQIPFLGPLLFDQPFLIYLALLTPFAVAYVIYRTAFGLRILAAGDGPKALATAGVSPTRVRWMAFAVGGALASLGGTYLAISHASQFTRDMTAGRGYIALTALIFGKWKPVPTLFACLFFGFFDALQIRLQSSSIGGFSVPVQFIQMLPYVAALVLLAGFIGRAEPPLAIGKDDR